MVLDPGFWLLDTGTGYLMLADFQRLVIKVSGVRFQVSDQGLKPQVTQRQARGKVH